MVIFLDTNDRRTQPVLRTLPVGGGATVVLGGGVAVVDNQLNVVAQEGSNVVVVPQTPAVVVAPNTPGVVTVPSTPGVVVTPSDANSVKPICN